MEGRESVTPTTGGGGENYPESAWGVRPRRRGKPSASEASAVPDTHQVPHGTRLEARTVRHSPLGDTTHAGPSSLWSTPASDIQHPRRHQARRERERDAAVARRRHVVVVAIART